MSGSFATRRKALAIAALILGLFPFLLVPTAVADDATVTPASDGWYWDRPKVQANPPQGTPPEVGSGIDTVGDPLSTQVATQFAGDHLYVGWDPADTADRREMFAGVNFDLASAGIPTGSTITKFMLTVLEHPEDNSDPRHGTANGSEARGDFNTSNGQGQTRAVICPFPDFAAGSPGAPRSEAPRVQCGVEKAIPTSIATTPYYPAPAKPSYAWTFDLTQMMNGLFEDAAEGDAFTSIALVADVENPSNEPWITSFHGGGYAEETAPGSLQFNPRPGILASVSWTASSIVSDLFSGEGLDAFAEFETESFGGEDVASTGIEDTGIEGDVPETEGVAPVAGVFVGNPAEFWDVPIAAWIAGILGAIGLGFSGWLLTNDPVAHRRPPGAVSALMRGGEI